MARPAGAWIIAGDDATWKPAVDVNRIVLGGQIVALAAIAVAGRVLLSRAKQRPTLARRRARARFARRLRE
jgi:hypothetical protein